MPGIDLVTEAQIISEIGDINRFPDSDKLARFMAWRRCNSALPERAKTKGAGMATGH
ncbi:mobile element protein [Acetivibrio straminisolvens JCM 21531]|uniref:Mobile element protein n=1 Tax=Acetivibrio straminisolvens JCM 21531 TaxID=1294263 RepID=W4VDW4_9FIRM|nr:mobile element protein [Acetivibrio straminisolvens JCM 21531]